MGVAGRLIRALVSLRAQIHFAEEWNELHHLQIMESLGGDQFWVDRFMAQHAAVFYYWVIVGFFAFSPQLAYIFSELVEARWGEPSLFHCPSPLLQGLMLPCSLGSSLQPCSPEVAAAGRGL